MNSIDAINYLRAIAEQRVKARESIIAMIVKYNNYFKRNYVIGELYTKTDGELCTILTALEVDFNTEMVEHQRGFKAMPMLMILLIMVASCFAGCSTSRNAARIEQCPTFNNGAYGQR